MDWKKLSFSFQGRTNRKPFWLSLIALGIGANILTWVILYAFGTWAYVGNGTYNVTSLSIPGIVLLVLLWAAYLFATLALYTKRWHDRNKSGLWSFIACVPMIGALWLLIECGFLRGTDGPNRFGEDPLGGN